MDEREHEHTIRRVLSWGWGASLAAGTLTGILGKSAGAGALVAGIGAALPIFYGLGCSVLDDLAARKWFGYTRKLSQKRDTLTTDHIAKQNELNAIRVLPGDANGRLGVTFDGSTYHNMDTGEAFTQLATVYLDPMRAQLDAIQRTLIAMRGINAGNAKQAEALLDPARVIELQTSTLDGLLTKYAFRPRLHQVLIGEYVDETTGAVQPLTLDIPKSVHVLCTGASGLGKSTLLEAIALQLAGLEGVQLAAVDYGSGTFDRLEPALRWQIADTPGLAIALFAELIKLINERRAAWQRVGRVRSLDQYNVATGENLPFVACFVDETSALLDHPGTKNKVIELARMGRKYGVGLLLGGTDFKADTLPTEARSNCQARIAFWLEPGLSRSLLNSNEASELGKVGDIICKKPGTIGTIKGHTPNVTDQDYARLDLRGLNSQSSTPATLAEDEAHQAQGDQDTDHDQAIVDQVRAMHAGGESLRAIERAVFGYTGGKAHDQVKAILGATTTMECDETTPSDGDQAHTDSSSTLAGSNSQSLPDWCEFCNRTLDSAPAGVVFTVCDVCGVALCSDCAHVNADRRALCPNCAKEVNDG